MNLKSYIIIVLSLILFGCSNTGQTVLTEFNSPNEERTFLPNVDIPLVQDKDYIPYFVSSQTTSSKEQNTQKKGETLNRIQELRQDKVLNKNEPLFLFLDSGKARDLINKYRKNNNLKPLKLNPELTEAAKAHSKDLSKWDRFSHYGSDGSNPSDRINRTGYKARISVENIGTGQANFEQVLDGWTKSPGQNKNLLLSDVSEMGLALVQDPKTEFKSFWTLILAAPI